MRFLSPSHCSSGEEGSPGVTSMGGAPGGTMRLGKADGTSVGQRFGGVGGIIDSYR